LRWTPLLRAIPVAYRLPEQLKTAFGETQPPGLAGAPTRPKPLAAVDLWRSVDSPEVRSSSLIYSKIEDKVLRLDFYMPPRISQPAPCVIVIHGGYWRAGDSKQLAPLNTYLAARGYAVAAINYRLVPHWPFPAARDDVIATLAYLKAKADSLHLDAQRFILLGRSAGGQLALLVAYTLQDPAIRGVVSFYGPTDMHWSYANPSNPLIVDSKAVLEAYLSGNPEQAPANYDAASPLRFIDASTPPTLLIHGGRDELVFFRQSERLAERLAQIGIPHFLLSLPWATHGFDFNFSGPGSQISTYTIERFLAAVMKTD
jgi:acetyl esterase/lipase